MKKLPLDWQDLLHETLVSKEYAALEQFVDRERERQVVYPSDQNIFRAFELTPFKDVKVLILGQDPYHGKDQAHGLAFSVATAIKTPPSLKNIYKELVDDLGCPYPTTTLLEQWSKEGVLLLNAVLSVEDAKPNAHKGRGWEYFSDRVIKALSDEKEHLVFILWGKPAQSKLKLIDEEKHLVLQVPHPSPLSSYRGFFGSKPFSKSNTYLKTHHIKEIQWCLS